MNLKKSTKYLLFIVVIVIAGIVVSKITEGKIVIPLRINDTNELDLAIEGYANIENKINDKILKDFSIISEKKDTLLLSSLLSHPKLIYRFSELHCDSCIIHEFENLRKHIASEGLESNDIIIISYYENPRNLNIFKRINRLQNFEIYNLMNNNIGNLEIDNIGVPYFFMLDKELKISNTFIPIKIANQRTDEYLQSVLALVK